MSRIRQSRDYVGSVVAKFIEANRLRGYDPQSEALRVLAATAQFGGWKYRITRELRDGWVDCSTLVSQAHWSGAGVGVPFVAETQRRAYTAEPVPPGEVMPSDVLVRYTSRALAPDGRHNHVVMYLGKHPQMGPWVIESAAGIGGVRVRPMNDDDAVGGVRRFLPFPSRSFPRASAVSVLAGSVPKLGRLGARLTSDLAILRRHRGVDLYCRKDFEVLAPISGAAIREPNRGQLNSGTVHILSENATVLVTLRTIEWPRHARSKVRAGESIGICRRHPAIDCNGIPSLREFPRLHLEFWSAQNVPFHSERDLVPPHRPDELGSGKTMRAFNAIYAIKLGILVPPVRLPDMTSLLSLPPSFDLL
jgi:cell wall-associated NlpC family hydrolase